MNKKQLDHYLSTGTYTYAGAYADVFRALPDDPRALGELVSHQIIHRVTLVMETRTPMPTCATAT